MCFFVCYLISGFELIAISLTKHTYPAIFSCLAFSLFATLLHNQELDLCLVEHDPHLSLFLVAVWVMFGKQDPCSQYLAFWFMPCSGYHLRR
jgi:hypothetical protein